MHRVILTVGLGLLVAANCLLLIFTTNPLLLIAINLLVASPFLVLYLVMEIKTVGLARELGLSRTETRRLIGAYFTYYRNVERISIYEYYQRSTCA